MKNIVRAFVIVAVLNLLGVLGLAGYLASGGRLNKDRLMDIVGVVRESPEDRAARVEAEQLAANPPPVVETVPEGDIRGTDQRNEARVEVTMIDRERLERLRREVADLQTQLRRQRQMLANERAQFEVEKADFSKLRDHLSAIEGAQAFKKALEVLTGMKPADVKPVLTTLLDEGKADEVVAYLAAFDDRQRAKVMTEFVKANENEVAAGLLESLRTRGLEPASAGVSSP